MTPAVAFAASAPLVQHQWQRVALSSARPATAGAPPPAARRLHRAAGAAAPPPPTMVSKVFVAGGAGRTGARVVRALATRGISVRVGCRDVEAARATIEGTAGTFAQAALLTYVPVDVVDRLEGLRAAIGDADAVVSALGATSAANPALPYKVDSVGTSAVWAAAAEAGGVEHAVMVSSLGTERVKFPAALLNLFWGILLWKRQAEVALAKSGIPYTIVRPGGLEAAGDDYGDTHNVVLGAANAFGGGTVSRLQVADVVAEALVNPVESANKVVEVVAKEDAPKRPIKDLFAEVPVYSV